MSLPLPLPKVAAAVRTADWNCRYGLARCHLPPGLSAREEAGPPLESFTRSSFPLHLSPGSTGSAALAPARSFPLPLSDYNAGSVRSAPLHEAPACLGAPLPSCASIPPGSSEVSNLCQCPSSPAAAQPTEVPADESWLLHQRGESQVLPQRPKPVEGPQHRAGQKQTKSTGYNQLGLGAPGRELRAPFPNILHWTAPLFLDSGSRAAL